MERGWNTPDSRRLAAGALVIVLLTAAAYLPALRGGFLWDDDIYLTGNRLLTEPGGLGRIWFSLESPSQYFPLVYTTFLVERSLWGLNPLGYHLVNLLLHLANALLLWIILRRLSLPGAWLAAALFALHPVQVESVAWITERKNVLSGFFSLLTVLAWLTFARGGARSRRWYPAALLLFMAALLAKTTAAVLPVTLLLVCWLAGERIGRWRLLQAAPFVALGAAMAALSLWWEVNHQGTTGAEFAFGPAERILIAGRSLWFHLSKVVWPAGLTFSYPRWDLRPARLLDWLWPAAALAAALLLWRTKRCLGKGPTAAAIHYFAGLLPVLGFVPLYSFRYSFAADHYQYLALIGPAVLAAAALQRLSWRAPTARRLLAGGLVLLLALLTFRQAGLYRNAETLWRDTLARNPASWMARANLGKLLAEEGRLGEALAEYTRALDIRPRTVQALYGKGYVLLHLGRPAEALPFLEETVGILPRWDAHETLGLALARLGRFEEAENHLREALRLEPGSPGVATNLGSLMLDRGRAADAVGWLERAVELAPGDARARAALGEAYARLGRYAAAEAQLAEALRIDPANQAARNSLDVIHHLMGSGLAN